MNIKDLLDGFRRNFQEVLTLVVVIICVVLLIYILRSSKTNVDHAAEIRTVIGTVLITVVNYWFGSSSGSKKKEEQIKKMIDKE